MSESNKAIVRRFIEEVSNQGNLDVVDELFAAEYRRADPRAWHDDGPEGVKALAASIRGSIPDFHMTIEEQIAEGDAVATRWTCRGTHECVLFGMEPTGKSITWTGITIHRIRDGQIVEGWIQADSLGLREQLGAV